MISLLKKKKIVTTLNILGPTKLNFGFLFFIISNWFPFNNILDHFKHKKKKLKKNCNELKLK